MAERPVFNGRMRRTAARAGKPPGARFGSLSAEPLSARSPSEWPSGRLMRVEMVQAAYLSELDHHPMFWSLHWPWNRAVLRQRSMGTRMVMVLEVALEDGLQMSFADDDHAIQAFATDAPDQSLDVRILPRRVWRHGLLVDPKGRHTLGELGAAGAIAVARQVSGRRFKRERVDQLLAGPSRRRSLGDREMQHLPALVRQDHEDNENAEGGRSPTPSSTATTSR